MRKRLVLLALAPMLLAASPFTAAEFEFSARFISLIQQNKLPAAKRMMAPNAVIKSWADYDAPSKSLESFAAYITKCPVHTFEAVVRDDGRNINVNLNCKSYEGASLEFRGGRISKISYGGPPPLVRFQSQPE